MYCDCYSSVSLVGVLWVGLQYLIVVVPEQNYSYSFTFMSVLYLFLAVPWVSLRSVSVAFPVKLTCSLIRFLVGPNCQIVFVMHWAITYC